MEQSPTKLPRVTIEFCTQCKWMLRAAYFAQELLSTFSTALGEVALQPSTGGTFTVKLYASPTTPISSYGHAETQIQEHVLWDRKAEGGFPETKELKRRVRDVIDPNRDLGHIDGHSKTKDGNDEPAPAPTEHIPSGQPIPRAINRLQASANPETAERKFTPMDVDVNSRPVSRNEEGEVLNSRGKVVISGGEGMGEDFGFCRPGDEDCG